MDHLPQWYMNAEPDNSRLVLHIYTSVYLSICRPEHLERLNHSRPTGAQEIKNDIRELIRVQTKLWKRKTKCQWPHPRHWLSQPTKRWGSYVASCVPDQATYIGQQFNVHRSLTHGSSVRMHRETVRARRSLTHGSNVYGQRDTVRTSLPLDVLPDYEFRQKWSKVIRKKKFQWPHPRHWLSQPTKRWGFSCCAHRTGQLKRKVWIRHATSRDNSWKAKHGLDIHTTMTVKQWVSSTHTFTQFIQWFWHRRPI